jgi:hypothetical protein
MCCSFSRRTNRIIGYILLTIFIGVAMGCFIYSLSSYKTYDSKYNPNQLNATLAITSAAVVFFFTFLGIAFLCCDSKILTVIFVIIWIGLFLLAFIVGIICLVLSVNANIINSFTCNNMYNSRNSRLDVYMAKVDETFCSARCPCDIATQNLSKFAGQAKSIFDLWSIAFSTKTYNFGNCPSQVKTDTFNLAEATDYSVSFNFNYRNSSETFDQDNFFKTWNYLETTYKCSGFCNTTYTDTLNKNRTMYKYLFSDVNNGVPDFRDGCYKAIVNGVGSYFSSYGSYILIISIFMLIILINLFSYLCSSDAVEDSRNIMLNKQ